MIFIRYKGASYTCLQNKLYKDNILVKVFPQPWKTLYHNGYNKYIAGISRKSYLSVYDIEQDTYLETKILISVNASITIKEYIYIKGEYISIYTFKGKLIHVLYPGYCIDDVLLNVAGNGTLNGSVIGTWDRVKFIDGFLVTITDNNNIRIYDLNGELIYAHRIYSENSIEFLRVRHLYSKICNVVYLYDIWGNILDSAPSIHFDCMDVDPEEGKLAYPIKEY